MSSSAVSPAVESGLFLGLMSGTSLDGVDAAIVRFSPTLEVLYAHTYSLSDALATQLLALTQSDARVSLEAIGRLDSQLGQCFADVVKQSLRAAKITPNQIMAIGSHGQTLRHGPTGDFPYSLQLGDANIIAEQTGIATIADFRRRDVAAGGQGAPLVPAFHRAVFADATETRCVVNIGGIANISMLFSNGQVQGFDTGPGNGLMDAWCYQHQGQRYDADGRFAAQGQIIPSLLQDLMLDPWIQLSPPKSTGRDYFNLQWLNEKLDGKRLSPGDVQATLTAFTAQSIAQAIASQSPCARLLVCGGGARNPELMRRLQLAMPNTPVHTTAEFGLHPDYVEAAAFAWLARAHVLGQSGNLPSVTGARGLRVLGALYPASA